MSDKNTKRLNLIGKSFGMLNVIELDSSKQNRVYWICKCECGNIISVESYRLRNYLKTDCGCLKEKLRNKIIGKKAGRLTVVGYSDKTTKKGEHYLICDCECGTKGKLFLKSALFNKNQYNTVSCGCYLREGLHVKDRTKIDRTKHIQEYLYGKLKFRHRKLGFSLDTIISFSEFCTLIEKECYYCGLYKTNLSKDTVSKKIVNNKIQFEPVTNNEYRHNGIDRIDSNMGYVKNNVVTCCKYCNIAKSSMTQEEFYFWVESVYKFFIK